MSHNWGFRVSVVAFVPFLSRHCLKSQKIRKVLCLHASLLRQCRCRRHWRTSRVHTTGARGSIRKRGYCERSSCSNPLDGGDRFSSKWNILELKKLLLISWRFTLNVGVVQGHLQTWMSAQCALGKVAPLSRETQTFFQPEVHISGTTHMPFVWPPLTRKPGTCWLSNLKQKGGQEEEGLRLAVEGGLKERMTTCRRCRGSVGGRVP